MPQVRKYKPTQGSIALLLHFKKCDFWKCKNQKFAQKCRDDPKIISDEDLKNHTFGKKQSPKITSQFKV